MCVSIYLFQTALVLALLASPAACKRGQKFLGSAVPLDFDTFDPDHQQFATDPLCQLDKPSNLCQMKLSVSMKSRRTSILLERDTECPKSVSEPIEVTDDRVAVVRVKCCGYSVAVGASRGSSYAFPTVCVDPSFRAKYGLKVLGKEEEKLEPSGGVMTAAQGNRRLIV